MLILGDRLEEDSLSEAPKRTPRPVTSGKDAKSFPLSPTDGFVLARVDGTLDEDDLVESTGLPEAQVQASLAKLESLGLIRFESGPPPRAASGSMAAARVSSVNLRAASGLDAARPSTATPDQPAPAATSQVHRTSAPAIPVQRTSAPAIRVQRTSAPATSAHAAPVPTPPAEESPPPPRTPQPGGRALSAEERASLVEEVDLDVDLRRRILDAFHELDQRDHYSLLGVSAIADRKLIKRAYYDLAATFHPDRYFRKRLGSFKIRMEAVFARLTIAHDTLASKENRDAYDAYLGEQRISQAIEEHLAKGLAEATKAQATIESRVLQEENLGQPAAPVHPKPTPAASPQVDLSARREALARRLLGGGAGRPPSARSVDGAGSVNGGGPSPRAPMQPADAVSALKRRYEERVLHAKTREAEKFAAQADAATASGDSVAAANLYRIAANLHTSDAELEQKAAAARLKADGLLADTYMRQGRYEESQGQWPEAARSWSRVCKASPNNPIAHERAANAAVKAGGDLHEGVRLGQRACELEPKNALFRITLATCYSAAGMALNARRELDTAAQLAPHDDTIRSMIKRVGEPA
jgi:curved DNA-binding protein CbpA